MLYSAPQRFAGVALVDIDVLGALQRELHRRTRPRQRGLDGVRLHGARDLGAIQLVQNGLVRRELDASQIGQLDLLGLTAFGFERDLALDIGQRHHVAAATQLQCGHIRRIQWGRTDG